MKEHDWIVAGLENPERNSGEFRTYGMNIDNTLFLSMDRYLKSDFIKNNDLFKTPDGNFSEQKFKDYYELRAKEFKVFADIDDDFQYDLFDYRRFNKDNTLTKPFDIKVFRLSNPQESVIGRGFINEVTESPLSDRERAELNAVFDSATGKYLEYSPNDHALVNSPLKWFSDLLSEPLVLATYDDDGIDIDPITKMPFEYKKGLPKMNEEGKYYYETLNGRPLYGKQQLSSWDLLTVDGSALNKIDVLDSDDREKSIAGSIIKNAMVVAPLLYAPLAPIYSSVLITREILKALPLIDGYVSAVTGENISTPLERLTNSLAGFGERLTMSTSDYSLNKQFTLENIANLISDVALQWSLQKLIAQKLFSLSDASKLAKSAESSAFSLWKQQSKIFEAEQKAAGATLEFIEKHIGNINTWKESLLGKELLQQAMVGVPEKINQARNLGGKASLMYMALVSNSDVYQQMLEHGVTKREAALTTLASTLGMFWVDNSLHLGLAFFDELQNPMKLSVKSTLSKEVNKFVDAMSKYAKSVSSNPKKTEKIFKTAYTESKKMFSKYQNDLRDHTLGFIGKAITEGLEETMEEVATDLSKQLYQFAHSIKSLNTTTDQVGAWGYDPNNPDWMMETFGRYGMNFLGGFLGGGLFYGIDVHNGNITRRDDSLDNLLFNVKEYGAKNVLSVLEDLRKKGKLGSTRFSTKVASSEDGSDIFLPADENNISQNEYIYKILKNEIISIDEIVNDESELVNTDDLLFKMTRGQLRMLELANETKGDFSKGMIDRYNTLADNYINVANTIKKMLSEALDETKRHDEKYKELLNRLIKRKEELSLKLHDFTSAENAIDYMQSLLFNLDSRISKAFYSPTFDAWLENFHKDPSDGTILYPMTMEDYSKLSEQEQHELNEKYLLYKNGELEEKREEAWAAFKYFSKKLMPEFETMEALTESKRKYLKTINDIFGENSPFKNVESVSIDDITEDNENEELRFNYDSHLDNETELEYQIRDTKQESESPEDFENRKKLRTERLKHLLAQKVYNQRVYNAFAKVEDIINNIGSIIDPSSKRRLLLIAGNTQKELVNNYVANSRIPELNIGSSNDITQALKKLKENLSNFDEVTLNVINVILQNKRDVISHMVQSRADLLLKLQNSPLYGGIINFFNERENKVDGHSLILTKETLQKVFNAIVSDHEKTHDLVESKGLDTDDKIIEYINTIINESGLVYFSKASQEDVDKLNAALGTDYTTKTKRSSLTDEQKSAIDEFLNQTGNEELKQKFTQVDFNNVKKDERNQIREKLHNEGFNKSAIDSLITENSKKINLELFVASTHKLDNDDGEIIARTNNDKLDYNYYRTHYAALINLDSQLDNYDISVLFLFDKDDKLDLDAVISYINYILDLSGNEIAVTHLADKYDDDYGIPYNELNDDAFRNLMLPIIDEVHVRMKSLADTITSDETYKFINTVKSAREIENPIINIIKKLAFSLNKNADNIEQFLEKLESSMNDQGFSKFTLSPTDKNLLEESYDLLELAKAIVIAAYNSQDIENPYPHNDFANRLIKKYNAKMDLLPTVSDDVALLYVYQISSLLLEIGRLENGRYSYGSWRYWDYENSKNKALKFLAAQEADYLAKLAFYNNNRNLFKATDAHVDLLDNYDTLFNDSPDPKIQVYRIENLLYHNVHKWLKDNPGKTIKDLLNLLNINGLFLNNNTDLWIEQQTAQLDENTNYFDWTPMTKFVYLMNVIGISSQEFIDYLQDFKNRHPNLAALDIQQEVSRTGLAYQNNPGLFLQMLEWAYEKYKELPDLEITPLLIEAVFIHGNGGAGKSDVVVRQQIEFAHYKQGIQSDLILLSGPTNSLLKKLGNIGIGKAIKIEDMIEKMLGKEKFEQLKADIRSTDEKSWKVLTSVYKGFIGRLKSDVRLNKVDNCKLIIIDESTWIPIEYHSILSAYARQFNIPLILVGDDYLSGSFDESSKMSNNINPNTAFLARTSRIGITLRDTNILKWRNIPMFTSLIEELSFIPLNKELREKRVRAALSLINKLQLSYYIGSDINGDYITSSLDKSIIEKFKPIDTKEKKNFIAYVGTNTETLSALRLEHGENSVLWFNLEKDIQGEEFDYVIIDSLDDIHKFNNNNPNYELELSQSLKFIRRLYTLSTRGKKAAIFLDRTGQLQKQVTFTQDNFKGEIESFTSAITKFNEQLDVLYSEFNKYKDEFGTIEPTISSPSTGVSFQRAENPIVSDAEEDIIQKEDNGSDAEEVKLASNNEQFSESSEIIHGFGEALVYGENTLSGMPYEEEHFEITTKSNKTVTVTRRTYKAPILADVDEISDVALYTDCNGETYQYDASSRKHQITDKVLSLRDLKDCILFGIPFDMAAETVLSSFDFLTEEDYTNILNGKNVYIEVAPYNLLTDNYVGLSLLSDEKDKMAVYDINGTKCTLKVVAKWKVNNESSKFYGKTVKITLGLMADPLHFESQVPFIQKDLNNRRRRKINEQLLSGENPRLSSEIDGISWYLDNIEKISKDYTDNIESVIKEPYLQLRNNGNYQYDQKLKKLTLKLPGKIYFTGLTEIRTKVRNIPNAVPRLRLSNEAFDNLELESVGRSFIESNQDVTVSPIYIYKPTSNQFTKLAGKSVVFVTAHPLLRHKPNALLEEWSRQLTSFGKNAVRMLRLDVIGCSLTQLATPGIRELFKTQEVVGEETLSHTLPFLASQMAVRQIISLWNFRANLSTFVNLLNKSVLNGVEESVLKAKLIQLHDFYVELKNNNESITEEEFRDLYLQENPGDKLASDIWQFNDELSTLCREFRLGIGNITPRENPPAGKERNEFQIRRLYNLNESALYTDKQKEDGVYGIYLTRDLANTYLDIINTLFDTLSSPEVGLHVEVFNERTNLWENLKSDKQIDREEGIVAKILNQDNSKYRMFDDNNQKSFEQIPRIIIDVTRKALAKSKVINGILPNVGLYESRNITLLWNDKLYLERIYQYTLNDNNKYIIDKDKKVYIDTKNICEHETDVVDMLELCFHGTTDDFITKRLTASKDNYYERLITPQATDAYFKYGFFIDPRMLLKSNNDSLDGIGKNFFEAVNNGSQFTVLAKIDRPTFRLELIPSSIEDESRDKIRTIEQAEHLSFIENFKKQSIVELLRTLSEYRSDLSDFARFYQLSDNPENIDLSIIDLLWTIQPDRIGLDASGNYITLKIALQDELYELHLNLDLSYSVGHSENIQEKSIEDKISDFENGDDLLNFYNFVQDQKENEDISDSLGDIIDVVNTIIDDIKHETITDKDGIARYLSSLDYENAYKNIIENLDEETAKIFTDIMNKLLDAITNIFSC